MNFIILLILLVLSAWFSGMEIAMFSLSYAKKKELSLSINKKNKYLVKLLNNKQRLLVVILLGNNLVNITAASLTTAWTVDKFGSATVGVVTGIMTFLILIFGEIFPKAYFQENSERMALFFAPAIYFLQILLFPIVFLLEKLLLFLMKRKKSKFVSENEFKALSRLAVEEGVLDFEEHEMIMNVLSFNDTKIKNIMTPRYKAEILNDEAAVDQVSHFIAKKGFSRYPVFHNQKDNITGYVHIIDIMRVLNSDDRENLLEDYIQNIIKVNENEKVNIVFNKMRNKHIHMALVTRGKIFLGLVTMEDLLEELVGEIEDEKD